MSEARTRFVDTLGFGLDDFQGAALDAVDRGVNVLVSAPTGSGKTLVATYAIERALDLQQRAFYTTPLKALSNQKFHELGLRYGVEQVGLLTGDTSVNRGAPIVVMTTEVLRNMLLNDSDQLRRLGLVVLDEVHFLQDPYRGGVWEEVLILTPAPVRFVALSATVGNAEFLGEWLEEVRGPTTVVVETERPITLHHHAAVVRRGQTTAEIVDLLNDHRLGDEAKRIDNLVKASRRFRPGPKWRGPSHAAPPPPFRAPRRSEMLRALENEDLLPAIVFIFSRAACDDAVRQCRRDGLSFTTSEERARIEEIAHLRLVHFTDEDLAALEYGDFLDSLRHGITAHHAGMVPAFREIVEACFERGLLGVVFATETLALGINMPARSVVLERFTKYSDAGRAPLTSGEFAQMTGRAGRRGLDDEGHAVVCFATDVAFADVARIALSPPSDLHSSFRPTYNFTANLIARYDEATAVELVERSYAQFEARQRPAGSRRPLSELLRARYRVLEALGYATEWNLTSAGDLLRSLYHESDLLLAEAIRSGIFDDLEPASLAGLLSAFVYEARRQRPTPSGGRPVPRRPRRPVADRVGSDRRTLLAERVRDLRAVAAALREVEELHRVPHAREPDGSLSPAITAWARGASLGTVLDIADAEIGPTSPGDFVRHAKQVVDLLEQLARLGDTALASAATVAREGVLRSVVANSSTVHPRTDGPL